MGKEVAGEGGEDEGAVAETVNGGTVTAVRDVRCSDGGGSTQGRDNGEEESRFLMCEKGVEDDVADAREQERDGDAASCGLGEVVCEKRQR